MDFPQDGPSGGGDIVRAGAASFRLNATGVYLVQFQVSITQPGQLLLTLDGQDLPYTTAGRGGGMDQIVGFALVATAAPQSLLTVRNPAANPVALAVTPTAGGTRPVSAHLVILRLA